MRRAAQPCDFHFHRHPLAQQHAREFQQQYRSVGQSTISPPGLSYLGHSLLGLVGSNTLPRPRRQTPLRVRVPPPPPPPPATPRKVGPSSEFDAAITCLWLLTPLAASAGAVAVVVAISTNQWLHTAEKMPNPAFNGTGELEFLVKLSVSGLWTICQTNPGDENFNCTRIDYFPREEYAPDPGDSAMAIPYSATKSAYLLLLAAVLLATGCVSCALGHCATRRRICTFTAGILFVVCGLVMLLGVVMYISIFKAEVGTKLKRMSYLRGPMFEYRYGYSFMLYIGGFILVELAGTSAVLLFLYWYQRDWIVDMAAKKKYEAFNSPSHNYNRPVRQQCRKHSLSDAQQNCLYNQQRRIGMSRAQVAGPSSVTASLSAFVSPARHRRYYFDRETAACALHRPLNASTSLRDVSLSKSTSSLYGFPLRPPAPPTLPNIAHAHVQTHGTGTELDRDDVFQFQDEPPRSADTLAGCRSESIFQSGTLAGSCRSLHTTPIQVFPPDHYHPPSQHKDSPTIRYEQEFVRFNLDRPVQKKQSDTLRRTTPV